MSMEYGWKRMPYNPDMRSYDNADTFFDTKPMVNMDEHVKCRESWDEHNSGSHVYLKTLEDFESFNAYRTLDIKGTGLKKS